MSYKKIIYLFSICAVCVVAACNPDDTPPIPIDIDEVSLTDIPYSPVAYNFETPQNFPFAIIPSDNPLTVAGVELGRRLFYDPILSGDSTMSCAGCHKQELAFSDNTALSIGIDGIQGTRNAMPLINLAFVPFGLNWDGSANTLELQAAIPVTSAVELHETWANVEIKLKRHALYPKWFREAFGIEKKGQIKEDLARKAIAQFVRTLVSHESHYDQSLGFVDPNNVPFLTASEERGRKLLISENSDSTDKECTHCHKFGNRLFTDNTFRNNGLDESQTFFAFPDLGRGGVTGNPPENGTFRVPTLRNIMLTAPYMHDGRFATIEEVLDHYADHLKYAPNLDPLLGARMTGQKIYFTQQEKEDLINFLKTLTDTAFISNPKFSNPW